MRKENTIGILGGMGPEATVLLFQRILENTAASRDQDHGRILIDNNPKIPERLPAILGTGLSPVPEMVESGQALERAGADFLVIPCVSAHYFLSDLRQKIRLPFLSMLEETSDWIAAYEPPMRKVGLMAALGTVRSGFLQESLRGKGVHCLVSEEGDLQKVQENIFRVKDTKGGHDRKEIKADLREVGARLAERGAQGIVLGCTELSLVIDSTDMPVPVFDALTILARAAIREAGLPATNHPR